jgi:putative kinase
VEDDKWLIFHWINIWLITPAGILRYNRRMPADLWEVLTRQSLTLDQTTTPLQLERAEIEAFYTPIAARILQRLPALAQIPDARLLVAVAGPPGSGKTAFATLLVAVLNTLAAASCAVLIQQDGWHYPNAYLDRHTILYQGEQIPLRRRKGSPETYDTAAAATFLQAIKAGAGISYPVYSRAVHDPIPAAGTLTPAQRIAVVEGNYWLLQEDPWTQFQPLFDVTIFLTAQPDTLISGLTERHLRGGKTPEFTQRHMDFVDIPNISRVLAHSAPAQITVHKRDSRHIARVEFVPALLP